MKALICLAFLALLAAPLAGAGQDTLTITADMQFDYAETCLKDKDYSTAVVEFKRFIHFFPGDARVRRARFSIGLALLSQESFYEAAKEFDRIIRENLTDDLNWEAYFLQSRAFSAMGNTGYAEIILQNLLKLSQDPEIRDRAHLDLAMLYAKTPPDPSTLARMRQSVARISDANARAFQRAERLAVIDRAEQAPEKSPALAGALALVPGGGFLYCGRYKDALVSFGLNAGLIMAAYQAFDKGNTALGGVISFVGSGFYAGNVYGSVTAAHKQNQAGQIKILDRWFDMGANLDPENEVYSLTLRHPF